MKTLFVEIAHIANKKEFEVRGAAIVGASAASHVAAQINTLMKTSGALFSGALTPHLKRFEFYATMESELDRRLTLRRQTCKNKHDDNINIANAELFPAIAAPLEESLRKVRASSMSSRTVPKVDPEHRLHQALHLSELSSAMLHFTAHITAESWGHLIGPTVGLFLGMYEEHTKAPAPDPISELARLCDQLEELDEHLNVLAVGVHQVPESWGKGMSARTPLPRQQAADAVDAKLR